MPYEGLLDRICRMLVGLDDSTSSLRQSMLGDRWAVTGQLGESGLEVEGDAAMRDRSE
jgi:hypothetical protein